MQWAYGLTLEAASGDRASPAILVGHAGFHGPPGTNGLDRADALEVGYTVFPAHRGRGYAAEAVEALLAWARAAHGITAFLASVAPANEPSRAVLRRTGFVHVGEQMDDVDGLELVYERLLA